MQTSPNRRRRPTSGAPWSRSLPTQTSPRRRARSARVGRSRANMAFAISTAVNRIGARISRGWSPRSSTAAVQSIETNRCASGAATSRFATTRASQMRPRAFSPPSNAPAYRFFLRSALHRLEDHRAGFGHHLAQNFVQRLAWHRQFFGERFHHRQIMLLGLEADRLEPDGLHHLDEAAVNLDDLNIDRVGELFFAGHDRYLIDDFRTGSGGC